MLFYVLLIAASPFVITAFPQNLDNIPVEMAQVEPVASKTYENAALSKGIDFDACMDNCPMNPNLDAPVCGTDGVTYINKGHLDCARHCGKTSVTKANDGAC